MTMAGEEGSSWKDSFYAQMIGFRAGNYIVEAPQRAVADCKKFALP
jgi:hypothetical protein